MTSVGFPAGESPARQLVAPAGSNRSGGGGNETVEAFDGKDRVRRFREQAGRNESETADEPSKEAMWEPTRPLIGEGCHCGVHASSPCKQEARVTKAPQSHRGRGGRHVCKETNATWEAPAAAARDRQREAREGQARPYGVTERPVVAVKPGNAGGAKGPQFKDNATSDQGPGDWR